jgi:hypothetical protein
VATTPSTRVSVNLTLALDSATHTHIATYLVTELKRLLNTTSTITFRSTHAAGPAHVQVVVEMDTRAFNVLRQFELDLTNAYTSVDADEYPLLAHLVDTQSRIIEDAPPVNVAEMERIAFHLSVSCVILVSCLGGVLLLATAIFFYIRHRAHASAYQMVLRGPDEPVPLQPLSQPPTSDSEIALTSTSFADTTSLLSSSRLRNWDN